MAATSFSDAPSEITFAPSSSSGNRARLATTAGTSFIDAPSESTFASSSSSGNGAQTIFLTHSGREKDFVERLNKHLKRAGYSPFFDEQSIPIGVAFPKYIKQKARQAKVGVLVLSDDFMKSKWPMIELEILTKSCAIVIPVFFKLSPNDLTSPEKLTDWRDKWKTMTEVDVTGWENAVTSLAHQSGVVYRTPAREIAYIEGIVKNICLRFPDPVLYDVSYAKGVPRLIQEVERRFSVTPVIGMHGVGGIGKTTLCRIMANFYFPAYLGKSAVLEFPSEKSEDMIVQKCKKVLTLLTNASDDLLNCIDCFDQAVELMNNRMTSHSFFLAVDNIWEHSAKEARRILKVGLGPGSKVLFTSRSDAVLKELLENCDECVEPVPSVNEKEAIETFEAEFGGDLSTSKTSVHKVLNLCMFSGCHHPLALETLGRTLKRMGDASELERNLSEITLSMKGSEVEDLIRLNYDALPRIMQHMFLDVVIFRRTRSFRESKPYEEMRLEEMREVLSILYERGHGYINEQLQRLALAGLLTLESSGEVKVHDLYVALAMREANASHRFLLGRTPNMKEIRWGELERVVLMDEIAALELQDCPKLQLLYARRQAISGGLRLEGMNALCAESGELHRKSNRIEGCSHVGDAALDGSYIG